MNAIFDITKGKYSIDNGVNYTDVIGIYTRTASTKVLLTTGVSERNKALNIYDLAGNIYISRH